MDEESTIERDFFGCQSKVYLPERANPAWFTLAWRHCNECNYAHYFWEK